MRSATGLLTRGSLPRRLPGSRQWLRGGGASPLTAAGPSRIRTGFPHRAPLIAASLSSDGDWSVPALLAPRRRVGGRHLRVLVRAGSRDRARRLGSRAAQARARDRVRRARRAPRARDGATRARVRARRAVRDQRRGRTSCSCPDATGRRSTSRSTPSASRSGSCSGSPHGRVGSHDRRAAARDRPRRARRHAAALGRVARLGPRRAGGRSRTRCLRIAARRPRRSTPRAPGTGGCCSSASPRITRPPISVATRGRALRCRRSRERASTLGVFTDAPEPLARVALAQLGASRRVSTLESGAGALARLLETLGPGRGRRPNASRPPEPSVESGPWSSTTSEIASSTPCSSGSTGSQASSSASIARPSGRRASCSSRASSTTCRSRSTRSRTRPSGRRHRASAAARAR